MISQIQTTDASRLAHRKGMIRLRADAGTTVGVAQQRHHFEFGTPLGGKWMCRPESDLERQQEEALLRELFNAAVIPVKWVYLEPEQGERCYDSPDQVVDWSEKHGFYMRGHCLFYAHRIHVQEWVRAISDDRDILAAMEQQARGVVGRYRGRIPEYDLNNELLDGCWYRERLGDDIIKRMADWVLDEDPDVILYVNEHDIITGGDLDRYVALIEHLLEIGVPLGGIGCQGHLDPPFDLTQIKPALDRLAQFGLPIKITEHDSGIKLKEERFRGVPWIEGSEECKDMVKFNAILAGYPADFEEQKAAALEGLYRIAFEHPAVTAIHMWGYRGGHHWRTRGEIFRHDFTPLPAADAYRRLVRDEWWTETATRVGADGICEIPVFFGTHQVTVGSDIHTVAVTPEQPHVSI